MHIQANMRRAVVLYWLVYVLLKTTSVLPESRTYRNVEVTRIFHAVTSKGRCLAGRGWYTSNAV